MINYPSNLPAPLIQGYSYEDNQRFVRDNVEIGPLVYAESSDDVYTVFSVEFSFNPVQKQGFEFFVETTLENRAKSFNLTLKKDGKFTEGICYISDISYSSSGKRWRATATIIMVKEITNTTDSQSVFTTGTHYWKMQAADTQEIDQGTSISSYNPLFIGTGINAQQASLRADSSDFSIGFDVSSNFGAVASQTVFNLLFSGHFTVEMMARFDTVQNESGNVSSIGVYTPITSIDGGVFNLICDNFDTGTGNAKPSFQLIYPGELDDSSDYAVRVIGDARSASDIVLGYIYHLLGTFNAVTRKLDLYVNGVLVGTDTITLEEYLIWRGDGTADNDLNSPTRTDRKTLYFGKRPVSGQIDQQSGLLDNIIIHSGVFMDATQAALQAGACNFD